MAKGGTRSRSGPPADPNALRRERDQRTWEMLPATGRQGDPPAWPLTRPIKRELVLWEREWRRPQAVMWERNGQELEVALYVRTFVESEVHDATVARRTLVRQQMEALGISAFGLARNRWRIAHDSSPASASPVDRRQSARDRFRVVEGEGA